MSSDNPQPSDRTRRAALGAPACLLAYAILRWVDGLDGRDGTGTAWTLGHLCFLAAFVLLAAVAAGMHRPPLLAAVVLAVTGAASFIWVALCDLGMPLPFPPQPVTLTGALIFLVGFLTLMGSWGPRWAPLLVLAGFVTVHLNLDLLPVAALLIGAGLLPLARPRREVSAVRPR